MTFVEVGLCFLESCNEPTTLTESACSPETYSSQVTG